jgi:hypothetical protein
MTKESRTFCTRIVREVSEAQNASKTLVLLMINKNGKNNNKNIYVIVFELQIFLPFDTGNNTGILTSSYKVTSTLSTKVPTE